MRSYSRRTLIRAGLAGCLTHLFSAASASAGARPALPTPEDAEGPFYPYSTPADQDADLTRIDGISEPAKGQIIEIEGQVSDSRGQPLEGVRLEIWQANAAGRYHHPRDRNPAPVDPGFQGYADITSTRRGQFRFRTVMPGSYPAETGWIRPPHIHFRISRTGYRELITQMYFRDHPLNAEDRLFRRHSAEEQLRMTALPLRPDSYRYLIVLQPL